MKILWMDNQPWRVQVQRKSLITSSPPGLEDGSPGPPQEEGRPAGTVRLLGGDDGLSQSSETAAVVFCVFNDWARAR